MKKLILLVIVLLILPTTTYSKTWSTKYGNISLTGFIGYRYLYSSAKGFPVDSGMESGLNGIWRYNSSLSTSIQIIHTEGSFKGSLKNKITHAFVTYSDKTPFNIFDRPILFDISAGALRYDIGLYNKHRLNPLLRPGGTIESQSIYWSKLESMLSGGLGVEMNMSYDKWTAGISITKPNTTNIDEEFSIWGAEKSSIKPKFGSNIIVNVEYRPNNEWLFKGSYLNFDFFKPDAIRGAIFKQQGYSKSDSFQAFVLSSKYESPHSKFTISSEYMITKLSGIPWSEFPDDMGFGTSILGTYHYNENLDLRLSYSYYCPPKRSTKKLFSSANMDSAYMKQHDIGVGLSYRLDDVEFKLDAHYVKGGNFLDVREWNSDGSSVKNWWYFGTSITYTF
jgi:hypothetical protein